jgi:lipopolysaccharide transport system permease protein
MKVLWGAWRHWMLITTMARRQFQLRYRQSLVGVTWAILPTLGTLLASTLVFHKVAGVSSGTMPYALVTLSALVPWSFFAASISTGVPSISNAQPLVTRLAFPKAVIPLSNVGTSLIDMCTTLLIFVVWVIVAGIGLPLTALWVPVLVVLELGLIVGVLLLCSALNVFARDMKLLVPLLTSLWLLVTPVMYPLSAVPADLRGLYLLNPMTGLVESFRGALLLGLSPHISYLLPSIAGAVVFLIVGTWYFGATESRFADVI